MLQLGHWTGVQHAPVYSPASSQHYLAPNVYPTPAYPVHATYPVMPGQSSSWYGTSVPQNGFPVPIPYASSSYQYPDQIPAEPISTTVSTAYGINNRESSQPVIKQASLPEQHGIIITGLRSQITENDLEKLLKKTGNPLDFELRRNGSSNQPRASAVANFATTEEARHAVRVLNGRQYSGVKLRAWPGKELNPVETPPQPLVVNGSTGYQVSARPEYRVILRPITNDLFHSNMKSYP
jgi:hypothetical protein